MQSQPGVPSGRLRRRQAGDGCAPSAPSKIGLGRCCAGGRWSRRQRRLHSRHKTCLSVRCRIRPRPAAQATAEEWFRHQCRKQHRCAGIFRGKRRGAHSSAEREGNTGGSAAQKPASFAARNPPQVTPVFICDDVCGGMGLPPACAPHWQRAPRSTITKCCWDSVRKGRRIPGPDEFPCKQGILPSQLCGRIRSAVAEGKDRAPQRGVACASASTHSAGRDSPPVSNPAPGNRPCPANLKRIGRTVRCLLADGKKEQRGQGACGISPRLQSRAWDSASRGRTGGRQRRAGGRHSNHSCFFVPWRPMRQSG